MLSFVEKSSSCTPLVIGTTGLSDEHFKNMSRISRMCPIFYSPNMSYAVAVMNLLIRISSCLLDESFDAEILDVHHRQKKDAPSGTSIMFGKTIAESRNRNLQDVANFSRLNSRGARELGEIGFSSQRCGNVAGMHEVSFSDLAERIKITHEAYSKAVFAKGAIGAARWLLSRSPAFYTMNDMLREKIGPELSSLLSKCGSGNV
jgi:4-hydroxy-tetrahydrodipicolinate reductase